MNAQTVRVSLSRQKQRRWLVNWQWSLSAWEPHVVKRMLPIGRSILRRLVSTDWS